MPSRNGSKARIGQGSLSTGTWCQQGDCQQRREPECPQMPLVAWSIWPMSACDSGSAITNTEPMTTVPHQASGLSKAT